MSRHRRAPDPNDPGTWNTPDPVATPAPAPEPVAQPEAGFDPWSWLMPDQPLTRPYVEPDPTDPGTWNSPPSSGFPMDLLPAFSFLL